MRWVEIQGAGRVSFPLPMTSDFDPVTEVLGRGGKRWLVVASVRLVPSGLARPQNQKF